MMKQTHINWRKATENELKEGSEEMIKVSEEEIEVPDVQPEKIDLSNIDLDTLPEEQIKKLYLRIQQLNK